LSVSVENLDKIIKIIRSSKTPDDAKQSILKTKWKINKTQKLISLVEGKKSKNIYSLSEDQVVAILELRLQKLTALGINEIEVEIKKLAELITKYKKIISSKKELLKVISEELKNIKEKFAVPRRTKIIDAVLNYDIEETIQKQSVIITVTLQGYIKRGSLDGVKTAKKEVVRVNLALQPEIKIQSFKRFLLTRILLFFSFLLKVWFIRLKHGRFQKVQLHLKVNHYLIFYL
jgi:DNA gyrase subunit A